MFNLKIIQRTTTSFAIVVFVVSFVLTIYFAISNPNGFLANGLGVKPITAYTTTDVSTYSYSQEIQITEDVKIKDELTTLVSKDIITTFEGKSQLSARGIFFLKTTDAINLNLSSVVNVDLSSGEYIINTNPIKIYVLSGKVIYNSTTIAVVNQVAAWLVDNFKASTLNTDDFVLNRNYADLIILLKNIELVPSALTTLSLDFNSVNNALIQVNETEDPELTVGCESSLLNLQIICSLNRIRAESNLETLSIDETLNNLTFSHVIWMDSNGRVTTIESNGLSYKERCAAAEIECIVEINLNIAGLTQSEIIAALTSNTNLVDKNARLIGLSISGNYLSILLR